MDLLKNVHRRWVIYTLTVIMVLLTFGCDNRYKDLDLSMYQYRDTRSLVKFVYDAAKHLEKDGIDRLEYFRNHRQQYNNDNYYLYIYNMNGINLFHAGMPKLEGQNLYGVTDKAGKKVFEHILSSLADDNNPHSWAHYSWWEPGKFYSVPKSSCHFKVRMADGTELIVGGGLNYPPEEKEFVRIIVDGAAQRIKEFGAAAFAEVSSPLFSYSYRDVRVFAFRPNGEILISPVTEDALFHIKLLECVDVTGHKPFQQALFKLRNKPAVWEVFMAKTKYQRQLVKKCLYIRTTTVANDKIYVGAITDLPHPL